MGLFLWNRIDDALHAAKTGRRGAARRGADSLIFSAARTETARRAEARLVRGERPKAHSIVPDGQ